MASKQYAFPDDCRYTETDEWVRADGRTLRVGITDYAQSELSDVVFVELPEVGAQVQEGEAFGVIESVKAVSDLYAPCSGEIAAINSALAENPEWVNEDPYERGWIVEITSDDLEPLDRLMTAKEYRDRVEERSGR
jgi:glycine cleavage system H protein